MVSRFFLGSQLGGCWRSASCVFLASFQIGKLHIYFGQADGWSPLTYRDNLLRSVPDFPEFDAVVDKHDIPHAFVEFNSEITANVVADWINRREDK